jgi:serine/threonine protein kinase
VIRDFGPVTPKDIKAEVDVITTILGTRGHDNIVEILRHGTLPRGDCYIDMELCDVNLEKYIHKQRTIIDSATAQPWDNVAYVATDCSLQLKMQNVWTIMMHVASGLEFLHGKEYVHRDIKPPNSTYDGILG